MKILAILLILLAGLPLVAKSEEHIWGAWYLENGYLSNGQVGELNGRWYITTCGEWFLENSGEVGGLEDVDIDAEEGQRILSNSPLKEVVRVAVIDSGVERMHETFRDVVWHADKNFDPYDIAIRDVYGHGTAVAGTVVKVLGNANKSLYTLGSYRVFSSGGYTDWSTLAKALAEAVEVDHCNVVNFSGSGGNSSILIEEFISKHPETLFVFSAGNAGGSTPQYPAAYLFDNVISCSARDRVGKIPRWSNKGAIVGAPGEAIYCAVPSCQTTPITICSDAKTLFLDGTSFSAPIVTAILAGRIGEGYEGKIKDYLPDQKDELVNMPEVLR